MQSSDFIARTVRLSGFNSTWSMPFEHHYKEVADSFK